MRNTWQTSTWSFAEKGSQLETFTKKKCKFFKRKGMYVGHVVSEDGVQIDEARSIGLLIGHSRKRQKMSADFLGLSVIIDASSRT